MLGISEHDTHLGTVTCTFQHAVNNRIPRLKRIKSSVESGNRLTDWQIGYIDRVMQNTRNLAYEFDDYPEIQDIYTRMVKLYHDITDQALLNERLVQQQSLH